MLTYCVTVNGKKVLTGVETKYEAHLFINSKVLAHLREGAQVVPEILPSVGTGEGASVAYSTYPLRQVDILKDKGE